MCGLPDCKCSLYDVVMQVFLFPQVLSFRFRVAEDGFSVEYSPAYS